MELTPTDIKTLLTTLQESEFDQAEITVGDVRIAIARGGAALNDTPATASEPAHDRKTKTSSIPVTAPTTASPTSTPDAQSGHVVTSPSVGVFWRAPEPGSAPYVEIGQEVAVGDTVGIVEVMKLMNNISADVAGVVTAVHADNASSVQFGTALITIEPKA